MDRLIALPDLFIAATAIAYQPSFVTLNRSHFERVSELALFDLSTL